jgi:acetyl esterase/lipase
MNIPVMIMQIASAVVGVLAILLSIPLLFRFRWPAAPFWILKVVVSAFSPLLALAGVIVALIGWITNSTFVLWVGIAVVLIDGLHFMLVTRSPDSRTGFEQVFGRDWKKSLGREQKKQFLSTRSALNLPVLKETRWQQNIPFATVPGSDRVLLSDIWLPPENVSSSGIALIYLHGSAFYILDKDCGTRLFFSHLAAQGHLIMDVAYRLAPETNITGMVHDARRAIAWLKDHANEFGVKEDRIILCGGSAGGHLALLAAYTRHDGEFTPIELIGKDLNVHGVISLYGTCDLEALYYHTNQHITTRDLPGQLKKDVPARMPDWMKRFFGKDYHRLGFDKDFKNVGALAYLLGGHPDECPECYARLSPITHVHAQCPPTLLIHGAHDIMAPIDATRRLYSLLVGKKVPTILHVLPQTDHAFDLAFPKIAPAAHNAIYDVERFMALMAMRKVDNETSPDNDNEVRAGFVAGRVSIM